MIITRTSPLSGKTNQMDLDVTALQIEMWKSGMYIQKAMPQLSASEREFIMTGVTEEEWEGLFNEATN